MHMITGKKINKEVYKLGLCQRNNENNSRIGFDTPLPNRKKDENLILTIDIFLHQLNWFSIFSYININFLPGSWNVAISSDKIYSFRDIRNYN